MWNIIIYSFLTALFCLCLNLKAQNKHSKSASYYKYETECLEDMSDGRYVLMSWGKGSSKKEAIEQAKKNVILDILFKGVSKNNCNIRPIITEVQAREKYRSYTANFFKKEYKQYIKTVNNNKSKKKSKDQTAYGVKVIVNVEDLRIKLINDKILK